MADEDFGIVVAIKPDVAPGAKVVDQALEKLEVKAKQTGAAISQAVGTGGTAAFTATTEAAHKTATAVDEVEKKAATTGKTFAALAQQAIRGNGGLMEVIDAVGKIGLAMNTVNQAVTIGTTAVNLLGKAWGFVASEFDKPQLRMQWDKSAQSDWLAWMDKAIAANHAWIGSLQVQLFGADVESDKSLARRRASRAEVVRREKEQRDNLEYESGARLAAQNAAIQRQRDRFNGEGEFAPRKGRGRGIIETDPSGWDEFARDIAMAAEHFQSLVDDAAELSRIQQDGGVAYWDGLAQALGEIEEVRAKASRTGKDGNNYGAAFDEGAASAQDYAAMLEGPLAGALDGLIDQIATMQFSMEDWARSALSAIAKVIIQMLLLQAIQAGFGAFGGSSGVGRLLWGIAGGGPAPGGSRREAPGDPFGGGASGSGGAVFREPVRSGSSQRSGGGGGAVPAQVKVVVPFNAQQETLAMLKSSDAEQVVLGVIQRNRGKLGLR